LRTITGALGKVELAVTEWHTKSEAQKGIEMNRREFSQQLCGAALSAAVAKMAVAQQQLQDTSGKQHSVTEKPRQKSLC
jgi:hypothetical protein